MGETTHRDTDPAGPQSPARIGRNRKCTCPACPRDNGGLDFCARCRYNDCTPDRACCGQEPDE